MEMHAQEIDRCERPDVIASDVIEGVYVVEPTVHGDERASSSRRTGASGSRKDAR